MPLDQEHQAVLTWLRDTYQWELTAADASDPAWRLTRLIAYRTVLQRQAVADSVSMVSLEYAAGPMIDHLGRTYYQLPRNAGEVDDAYRARIAAAPSLFAVGLTAAWYEQTALQVDGVSSAFVVGAARPDEVAGTTPGAVTLALRADGLEGEYQDSLPDDTLLDAVVAAVTAPDVRQQTDRVSVVPAYRVPYDVTITLTLHPHADATAARAAAEAGMAAVCRATDVIGGRTSATLIAGAVVNPGVVREATVVIAEVLGTRAQLTHGAGVSGVVVTALATGEAGTGITLTIVDPGAADQALAITRAGDAITVSLATDAGGSPTTTAADLVDGWRTSPARRLATAQLAAADGSGVVAAAAVAPLVAGVIGTTARNALIAPANAGLSCRTATVTIT